MLVPALFGHALRQKLKCSTWYSRGCRRCRWPSWWPSCTAYLAVTPPTPGVWMAAEWCQPCCQLRRLRHNLHHSRLPPLRRQPRRPRPSLKEVKRSKKTLWSCKRRSWTSCWRRWRTRTERGERPRERWDTRNLNLKCPNVGYVYSEE